MGRLFSLILSALCLVSACNAQLSGSSSSNGASAKATNTPTNGTSTTPPSMEPTKPAAVKDPTRSESGSRLKVNYLQGADGSRSFLGFYDTARKEDCTFQQAEDGKLRCFPAAGATLVAGSMVYFEDKDCTKPLVYVSATACGGRPAYVAIWEYSSCPTYSVTMAEVDGHIVASTIYVKSGNTCTATPRPAAYEFYQLGDAIPDSEFVAAEKKTE